MYLPIVLSCWLSLSFICPRFILSCLFDDRPNQVKWQLMIASCHRRSGNYQQALETYKYIHKKFPDNIECLKVSHILPLPPLCHPLSKLRYLICQTCNILSVCCVSVRSLIYVLYVHDWLAAWTSINPSLTPSPLIVYCTHIPEYYIHLHTVCISTFLYPMLSL